MNHVRLAGRAGDCSAAAEMNAEIKRLFAEYLLDAKTPLAAVLALANTLV